MTAVAVSQAPDVSVRVQRSGTESRGAGGAREPRSATEPVPRDRFNVSGELIGRVTDEELAFPRPSRALGLSRNSPNSGEHCL